MSAIPRSADGYYHPRTEDEVRELILKARDEKKLLRCRGSGHSASAAIYTSCNAPPPCQMETPPDDGNLNVMLNLMNAIVAWDDAKKQVTVQAGCHLGLDPSDPTHTSTLQNSLFYQMDQRGWAIPDMGGDGRKIEAANRQRGPGRGKCGGFEEISTCERGSHIEKF